MALSEDVKKIIKEEFHHGVTSKGQLKLREEALTATCKEVNLEFDSTCSIACFKFDENNGRSIFPYFETKGNKDLEAMCDYLIFYSKDVDFVIVANLKSKSPSNNLNQLKAGEAFAWFLTKSINRFYSSEYKPKTVKVLFSSKYNEYFNLQRGMTNAKKTKEEKFYPYPCEGIHNLDSICKEFLK